MISIATPQARGFARTQIPSDKPMASLRYLMSDITEARLHELMEKAAAAAPAHCARARRCRSGDFAESDAPWGKTNDGRLGKSMVRNEAKKPVPYQALGVSLMIAVLILSAGAVHAQDQNGQACVDTLGYAACDNLGKPNPNAARQMIVLHFAALAISPTTMRAGSAHGQNSINEAEQ